MPVLFIKMNLKYRQGNEKKKLSKKCKLKKRRSKAEMNYQTNYSSKRGVSAYSLNSAHRSYISMTLLFGISLDPFS